MLLKRLALKNETESHHATPVRANQKGTLAISMNFTFSNYSIQNEHLASKITCMLDESAKVCASVGKFRILATCRPQQGA